MAADGLFLSVLARELTGVLTGTRIDRVNMPSRGEVVLLMRGREGRFPLYFSASGDCPRVCVTHTAPENPASPPMLCMLFRKHLTGGIFTGIRQEKTDRVLYFDFDCADEIGDRHLRTLVCELMPRYGNIILLDEDGDVIDAVNRVDLSRTSVRRVLPALKYELPPSQDKLSLTEAPTSGIIAKMRSCGARDVTSAVMRCVMGVSPLLARELEYRTLLRAPSKDAFPGVSEEQLRVLGELLDGLRETVVSGAPVPTAVYDADGKPLDISFIDITQYGDGVEKRRYPDLSSLLESFFREREDLARVRARARDLFTLLSRTRERVVRRLEAQRETMARAADRDKYRLYGDMIMANLPSLSKGASHYEVTDWYGGGTVSIPADPALTPERNAQRHYKEYKRMKTAEEVTAALIEKGENELVYIDSVIDELSRAEGDREISEIRRELADAGYLRRAEKGRKNKVRDPVPLPPLEYTTSGGFRVFAGRNNAQNDRLTFRTARRDDIWLHAQKMHGSHVILVRNGGTPSDSDIEEAARIAAYRSEGRDSLTVPVDYTEAGNVKKPNGSPAGFVIYHVYKTVTVRPSAGEGS
ncbi:MAG: NFACT family protein [Clostridiales bacterium]|nr:NFACT family protein [Clostridiales bacterium]